MIKIKNYLVFITLLLNYSVFAAKRISMDYNEKNHVKVINPINTQIPYQDIPKEADHVIWSKMNQAHQKIAKHACKDYRDVWELSVFNYQRSHHFGKKSNYSVYRGPTKDPNQSAHYSFSLKEKSYNKLKGFEKQVANYYNANNSTKIKFLYAWKNYESDPWAIEVNDQMHATIWVQGRAANNQGENEKTFYHLPRQTEKEKSFSDLSREDENKNINLLIDEHDQVIAKRIDGIITFKKQYYNSK